MNTPTKTRKNMISAFLFAWLTSRILSHSESDRTPVMSMNCPDADDMSMLSKSAVVPELVQVE